MEDVTKPVALDETAQEIADNLEFIASIKNPYPAPFPKNINS